MPKLFLNTSRPLAIFVALGTSMVSLSATPANSLTFQSTIYDSPDPSLENDKVIYTLADGIFETIISSPLNTFFTDGYSDFNEDPNRTVIVLPEVVTGFKWIKGSNQREFERSFEQSIFGITPDGLSIQILNPSQAQYRDVFISTIPAPEGLPLSACKTQACDGSAKFRQLGYYVVRVNQIPLSEEKPESVPEPSAVVALGFVSFFLLKRRRKAGSYNLVP